MPAGHDLPRRAIAAEGPLREEEAAEVHRGAWG
jgi:hypothetical protein